MSDKSPRLPFSGIIPDFSDDTPDLVIEWIKDGNTKIVDWDEAAIALEMSVDELRRRLED